ncbi:HigA family addiction module antitoxin [Sessilibacter sp. MAH4]
MSDTKHSAVPVSSSTSSMLPAHHACCRGGARFYLKKPEHPGEFLQRCYLAPLKISQSDLARRMGISRRRVNEIVNGSRAISPDTSIKLAEQFDTTPMFWLEKQLLWELYHALKSEKKLSTNPQEVNSK